ncbi:MAG TPA: hypothetical protein VGF73_01625 [Chthoniobacterales bacterium]|jgi:hypothetical protein
MTSPLRSAAFLFAAILPLLGSAEAGIGDTEKQIQARYGDALTSLQSRTSGASLTKCYSAHGLLIAVTFLHGRSVREMITKTDSSEISAKEINNLLQSKAGGSATGAQELSGPKNVAPNVVEWRSNDRQARVAFYDSKSRALFVTTQRFIDLTNAKQRVPMLQDGRHAFSRGSDINLRSLQRDSMMGHGGKPKPAASPAN